jgi:Ca-activated chloride channel family protein
MNARFHQILTRLSHLSFAPIPHLTFLWPMFLWLLLLVPLAIGLYVLLLYRRKKTALRFANLAMVKAAMGAVGWRRHVPPALMLLALTLLLIAVARPIALVTLPSNHATVILAMDVSGSMRATDVNPSRLEASQTAAKQYIKTQPKDVVIGIVAFAATAFLVQSPTVDHAALENAIDHFQLQRGTAVGSGILIGLKSIFPAENFPIDNFGGGFGDQSRGSGFGGGRFGRYGYGFGGRGMGDRPPAPPPKKHVPVEPGSYKNAAIILLTDGQTNTGYDPVEAAKIASQYGVKVYTVGFGTTRGNVVGFGGLTMRAQLDEDALKKIADTTRGRYFRAASAEDLKAVYSVLSKQLVMETQEMEISSFFAAAAALVMLTAAGLSLAWFSRVI